MINLLKKAVNEQQPIDIYFNINDGTEKCILIYKAFLVVETDPIKKTFSGFTLEDRLKPVGSKLLTEDTILAICKIDFH